MAGKIFVNYRRDDSASQALNVAQYLEREFGGANVFLDIDRLRAGQKFPQVLEERLTQSRVMLAVIGPSWLTVSNETGHRRLNDPEDWVRLEISGALARGIPVIPVLVGGASLPRKADLPDDLKPLADHQIATITTNGFRNDMAGLARDVRDLLRPRRRWPLAAGAGAAAVTALGLAVYLGAIPIAGRAALFERDESAGPVPSASPAPSDAKKAASKADEDRKREQAAAAADAKRKADAQEKERALDAAEGFRTHEADAPPARNESAETEEAKRNRERVAALEKAGLADRDPARSVAPGSSKTFRDCGQCPEMVVVPAGSFTMGAADRLWQASDTPAHQVAIARPFAMGKYEVTFAEWAACMKGGGCQNNPNPGDGGWGRDRRPVINVSWSDANAYVAWLSKTTGKTYRLPSEAEWEHAARAGSATLFSFGGDPGQLCLNANGADAAYRRRNPGAYRDSSELQCDDGAGATAEVGRYSPNAFGLYDMHGNVWEWVEDAWHDGYVGAPTDGTPWIKDADPGKRVLRGGGWATERPACAPIPATRPPPTRAMPSTASVSCERSGRDAYAARSSG